MLLREHLSAVVEAVAIARASRVLEKNGAVFALSETCRSVPRHSPLDVRDFAVAEWSKVLRLGRSKHPPQSLWLFVVKTVYAPQTEPFRPM